MRGFTKRAVLLSLLLCSAMLTGCFGDEDSSDESAIDLVVYYDTTSGMIQENIQNGQQVAFSGVDLAFDYAYTKSSAGDIASFYFEAGDGSSRITVDANETGEITYTYATHGLFTANLGQLMMLATKRIQLSPLESISKSYGDNLALLIQIR